MRWEVKVKYVTGETEAFMVQLADDFPLARDLGQNLTADSNDVLVCEDGSIIALPVRNVLRIWYRPVIPPPPAPPLAWAQPVESVQGPE
jgi:hypothetical protein